VENWEHASKIAWDDFGFIIVNGYLSYIIGFNWMEDFG
jgi:hypothetical protein